MNSTTAEGGLGSELRDNAQQVASSARSRLESEADSRKATVATQAQSVSSAIGKAADQLDDGSPEWLRSAFQKGAQQIQRFADTLEQKDSREIMNDVNRYARDNPTAFLAACAAAGFAAARLFKAGSADSSSGTAIANQGPPPQVDEPMFRPTTTMEPTRQPTGGEFA